MLGIAKYSKEIFLARLGIEEKAISAEFDASRKEVDESEEFHMGSNFGKIITNFRFGEIITETNCFKR